MARGKSSPVDGPSAGDKEARLKEPLRDVDGVYSGMSKRMVVDDKAALMKTYGGSKKRR